MQSKWYTRLVVFLPENGNRDVFWNIILLKNIRQWTKSQNQKIGSVNFSRALYSLLDFLTLEAGADGLSCSVREELLHYIA